MHAIPIIFIFRFTPPNTLRSVFGFFFAKKSKKKWQKFCNIKNNTYICIVEIKQTNT